MSVNRSAEYDETKRRNRIKNQDLSCFPPTKPSLTGIEIGDEIGDVAALMASAASRHKAIKEATKAATSSNPHDEMVLEAAINGRAEAIVTFNRKDYGDAARQFGIAVLTPAVAIKRIRG